MTRKPRSRRAARTQAARKKARARVRRAKPASAQRDALAAYVAAAARALDLPVETAWIPAIKANLHVTLQHAAAVAKFALPDDAEPAPVFRA